MRVLFLDIDGVLNDHGPQSNGYCGIQSDKVEHLNRILRECPDVEIVVSSAWRYCVLNGWCTLDGLEHLLLTHGVACKGRVLSVTGPDAEKFDPAHHAAPFDPEYWKARGLRWRVEQIREWVDDRGDVEIFVVLDDLPLDMPELVCTSEIWGRSVSTGIIACTVGLTAEHATEAIRRLSAKELSNA